MRSGNSEHGMQSVPYYNTVYTYGELQEVRDGPKL